MNCVPAAGSTRSSRATCSKRAAHEKPGQARVFCFCAAGYSPRVADVREVLDGRAVPAGRVLVVDDLGFQQATSVAELLADRGCAVTVCTSGMIVGQDLGLTLEMNGWLRRAHEKGIEQITDVVVAAVADDDGAEVTLLNHLTGETGYCAVDYIVVATHQDPVDELWQDLWGENFRVVRVGDAVTPRRLDSAIIEGMRAAADL